MMYLDGVLGLQEKKGKNKC
jgi:hypothetical protein